MAHGRQILAKFHSMNVVVDTSVMMDMFYQHRRNHSISAKLADLIRSQGLVIKSPGHQFFEISSAVMCEKKHQNAPLPTNESISQENPLRTEIISIDEKFMTTYLAGEMPDLASGDMIFVLIAKKNGWPLITEDDKMYKGAKKFGADVYTSEEFVNKYK